MGLGWKPSASLQSSTKSDTVDQEEGGDFFVHGNRNRLSSQIVR